MRDQHCEKVIEQRRFNTKTKLLQIREDRPRETGQEDKKWKAKMREGNDQRLNRKREDTQRERQRQG